MWDTQTLQRLNREYEEKLRWEREQDTREALKAQIAIEEHNEIMIEL